MLVAISNLVRSDKDMKQGNHSVAHSLGTKRFTYWNTEICTVNTIGKTFSVQNGGYKTVSTTRAINDYRYYFSSLGYTDISVGK